jgi:hypothetical protein
LAGLQRLLLRGVSLHQLLCLLLVLLLHLWRIGGRHPLVLCLLLLLELLPFLRLPCDKLVLLLFVLPISLGIS